MLTQLPTLFQKKFPLRFVLLIPFVIIISVAVSLLGYIAYANGQKTVSSAAHQISKEISGRILEHIEFLLETPRRINQFNTTSLRQGWINPKNKKDMQGYFLEQVKNNSTISSVYFGNTKGGIIGSGREGAEETLYVYATENLEAGVFNKYAAAPSGEVKELLASIPNFDARARPWYINAQQKGEVGWNDIYILFTGQDMALSASAPVYDPQNRPLGAVSVDVFLSQIGDFLHSLEISKSGQSFIIEHSGLLVAASSEEKPFVEKDGKMERLNARDSQSPIVKYAAIFLSEQFGEDYNIVSEKQLEFSIDNETYFLTASPLHNKYGIDWLVVVVIPRSDFTAEISATNRSTALIVLLALGIAISVSGFVSKKISDRVSNLNRSARAIMSGQSEKTNASNSRISEIDELTMSFIEMEKRLNQMLRNLKAEIYERKQIEETLRESEEHYRTIVTHTPVVTFVADAQGVFTLSEGKGLAKLGLQPGQVVGMSVFDVYRDYPLITKAMKKALGGSSERNEVEVQGVVYDVVYTPIFGEQGKVIKIIGVANDITERKQAENSLIELNADLEKRVEERALQLEVSNKELEAFSYSVSHDLRAPLRGIDGWGQALLEDYNDQLDEEGRRYIARIRAETQRMGELIEDMLQLSRLTRAEMRVKNVNLSELARQVVERLREEEPERDITVDIQEGLNAQGDLRLLESVLVNLLGNAFKFTSKTKNARVEFGQTNEGVFYARDNGAGFDMTYADKLFGAFQRMHKAAEFPGTGIGLAIVQRVIRRHGGEVWAEAKVNEGATFYFTLPD